MEKPVEYTMEKPVDYIAPPSRCHELQDRLDGCAHQGLVGLEYIVELWNPAVPHKKYSYFCRLCDRLCGPRFVLLHVIDPRHRQRYLQQDFPKLYREISGYLTACPARETIHILQEVCESLEAGYARPRPARLQFEFYRRIDEMLGPVQSLRQWHENGGATQPLTPQQATRWASRHALILESFIGRTHAFGICPDIVGLTLTTDEQSKRRRLVMDNFRPATEPLVPDRPSVQLARPLHDRTVAGRFAQLFLRSVAQARLEHDAHVRSPETHPQYDSEWAQFVRRPPPESSRSQYSIIELVQMWPRFWANRINELYQAYLARVRAALARKLLREAGAVLADDPHSDDIDIDVVEETISVHVAGPGIVDYEDVDYAAEIANLCVGDPVLEGFDEQIASFWVAGPRLEDINNAEEIAPRIRTPSPPWQLRSGVRVAAWAAYSSRTPSPFPVGEADAADEAIWQACCGDEESNDVLVVEASSGVATDEASNDVMIVEPSCDAMVDEASSDVVIVEESAEQ